jgi:hypothetical protein
MAALPKAICMFNTIAIKIQMTCIKKIEKSIQKFMWKHQRPPIAKEILSQKGNSGSITNI